MKTELTASQYKLELQRKSREALIKKYGSAEKFAEHMRKIAKKPRKRRKKRAI